MALESGHISCCFVDFVDWFVRSRNSTHKIHEVRETHEMRSALRYHLLFTIYQLWPYNYDAKRTNR